MGWKDSLEGLRRFAAAPWFPLAVGALSGLNLFALVLSAPLVVLYCSAVLANPRRWFGTAVANAVGTVAGCLVLVLLVDVKGTDFVKDSFPSTFQSKWWKWTEATMETYGPVATVPIAAMPIILHPLIFFAKLSNMSDAVLLGSILVGRILKYCIMAQMALSAPAALRFFGASKDTIEKVKKGE
mmetsp:Transcript_49516/g.107819  ORF Transcript_49516/g.107819 Transcript_49516/m.107819 type:complete len:184 (-) Transcript_49516:94-645(-)|eukprot:CAMPEP_0170620192 /NCGR_PEP_ID=MMETSP0224-20130122/27926_1 /TAXON_ID=285029 /ORGANISM="Togula jolla, Strain CCCM 725" /LENGTH=183 /DNA_ID=CAMNT_0010946347 /DNA_START=42 /DNA_END=593 /DNA_ORIENTATION=+